MSRFLTLMMSLFLVFGFLFLLAFAALVQQGKTDVQRELAASRELAQLLSTLAEGDRQRLHLLEQAELRHVVISVKHSIQLEDLDGSDEVPKWFFQLIWREDLVQDANTLYLPDGRRMWLLANPFDEVEEVWESVVLVFVLFVATYLVAAMAAFYGRRLGLKPFQLLATCYSTLANALELEQKSNQHLTGELMALQEKERAYLARELHDDLGQYVTGIRAQSYLISQTPDDAMLVKRTAEIIIEHCQAMQEGFLRLVRSLHPVILEPLGLGQSLQSLATQWQQSSGISCSILVPDCVPPLQKDAATHLYRMVQEALNNVARHAKANRVSIDLRLIETGLELVVDDNGQGLQANMVQGVGLRSMYERARCMNANLRLVSKAGQGLKIIVKVPVLQEGIA
ncbi:sensor histidine kinase [Nitrincola sp. A-D6]|uniref:sensor histidine kinase n=1 Tax=Nitrincola sp. A-D6 TaxID=1545442 RepID=UPI0009DE4AC8|nr:sensor histidine kinase [Nitrincola sp. A-D6]